jgi:hypothetical protein
MDATGSAMRSHRFLLAVVVLVAACSAAMGQVQHVFHISVDGLRPDAVTTLGPGELPSFYRLRTEGAFTDNARADYFVTETLPNHVTQLTGRGVKDPYGNIGAAYSGHDWTSNSDPDPADTLETNKGTYVAGVFDVAHAAGLTSGLYASKSKFVLFPQSWPTTIDHSRITSYDSPTIVTQMKDDIAAQVQGYTFLHLYDPDRAGHDYGWMGTDYLDSVKTVDGYLGEVFQLIATTPGLTDHTALVVTADHGGSGTGHADATNRYNYTIPFYVWGPGVTPGADLYALNPASRLDPSTGRPTYYAAGQPIHNGEASNLSLDLLGLGPIPGSWLDSQQDLAVPEPATVTLLMLAGFVMLRRRR